MANSLYKKWLSAGELHLTLLGKEYFFVPGYRYSMKLSLHRTLVQQSIFQQQVNQL